MAAYVVRRLMQSVLILVGVTFVTFILLFIVPADPARQVAGRSATSRAGRERPPASSASTGRFYEQYARYLSNVAQGDLGRSYLQKTEVATLIASRLPATLLLMLGAIFCELAIGLTPRRARRDLARTAALDRVLMVISFVGVSAPQFVVGILLLYVFARSSRLVPDQRLWHASPISSCRRSPSACSAPAGIRG